MTDRHSTSFEALRKDYHKSAKADKQSIYSIAACEMEKAVSHNDSRKVYQLLGESNGNKNQRSTPTLLSKDNKLLTSKEDGIEPQCTHFEKLLHPPENDHSQPTPSQNNSESPTVYEDHNIVPPSREEIIYAIKLLKNNKSPGFGKLPAEFLKALPDVPTDKIHNLLTDV